MGEGMLSRSPMVDLLALADTKWVLGHWYIKVMQNGRSVGDFCSLAGMVQEELGQTRALFRYLEDECGLPSASLEHEREKHQCNSMVVLDLPPSGWGDFVVTAAVAELATYCLAETVAASSSEEELNGLLLKSFQEEYFHQLLTTGWIKALEDPDRRKASECFRSRFGQAVRWFGPPEPPARALLSGARALFVERVAQFAVDGGIADGHALSAAIDETTSEDWENWDSNRQREAGSSVPGSLWSFMVPCSEAAVLARRPREVFLSDDFSTAGKSFDEYVREGEG